MIIKGCSRLQEDKEKKEIKWKEIKKRRKEEREEEMKGGSKAKNGMVDKRFWPQKRARVENQVEQNDELLFNLKAEHRRRRN